MIKAVVRKYNQTQLSDLGDGVCRRGLAWNNTLMIAEAEFQEGSGKQHSHMETQCTVVLSGKFRFIVDQEEYVLGPGDSISIPSGVLHGPICLEKGKVLDVFTPARKEFAETNEKPKRHSEECMK